MVVRNISLMDSGIYALASELKNVDNVVAICGEFVVLMYLNIVAILMKISMESTWTPGKFPLLR